MSKNEFWEEALLIKSHVHFFVPGWTLTLELAISLFIPFLIVLGKANRQLLWWLIAFNVLVYRVVDAFVLHFILGCIISFYYATLTSADLKNQKWYRFRYFIMLGAILLFSLRRIEAIFPVGPIANYWTSYFQLSLYLGSGIASFIFIIWIMRSPKAQRFLSHSIFRFIGKISYGIYLMHWLIVCFIFDNWDQIVPLFPNLTTAFITMMLLCFIATLILATALHYFIELPFMRFGKRLTSRLKPSLIIN